LKLFAGISIYESLDIKTYQFAHFEPIQLSTAMWEALL